MSGIERGLMSLAIPASDGDGYFTVTGHLEQSLAYLLIATLLAVTLVNYTGPDWSIGIRALRGAHTAKWLRYVQHNQNGEIRRAAVADSRLFAESAGQHTTAPKPEADTPTRERSGSATPRAHGQAEDSASPPVAEGSLNDTEVVDHLLKSTHERIEEIAKKVHVNTNIVTRTVKAEFQQVEATIQLHSMISPRWLMPPLGGWALDPRSALHLVSIIRKCRPKLVVELGSGTSTLWMGYVCEQIGARLVSIDHDRAYFLRTRELLQQHELEGVVDLRLAPLSPFETNGEEFSWYSTSAIMDLQSIDVLVVDGPPDSVGDATRFPALPALRDRLSRDATVLLDDSHRPGEIAAIERWTEMFDLQRVQENISSLAVFNLSARLSRGSATYQFATHDSA